MLPGETIQGRCIIFRDVLGLDDGCFDGCDLGGHGGDGRPCVVFDLGYDEAVFFGGEVISIGEVDGFVV